MLPSWISFWCFQQILRLEWKVIASYKHSSLFGLIDSDKGEKSYITLAPGDGDGNDGAVPDVVLDLVSRSLIFFLPY